MKSLRLVFCLLILISLVGFSTEDGFAAEAQTYPTQDIVFVVPYVPGGSADVTARLAAPFLRKYLPKKVNIIIQNVSAAGGRVGAFQIYDAKPDGYTIGLTSPIVFVVAQAAGESGKRDIAHMTWLPRAYTSALAMGVSPQSFIKNLDDIKKAKRLRASGTQLILAGNIAFLRFMGTEPQMIMYGGGADVCLAAMRGDVDLVITTAGTVLRQAETSGGRLIPKVVFSESRLPFAPNLPTAKELGVDVPKDILTLMNLDTVFAAPYGLPSEIKKTLNDAIEKTWRDPEFEKLMLNAKLDADMLPADEMQKRMTGLAKIVPNYIEAMRQALAKAPEK
jgi:tripartite-type tricarboxylate transporter receptor subunit TctC